MLSSHENRDNMSALKPTNLDIEALVSWASLKKKHDPSFVMLLPVPACHGVFLACPKGIYHGLFIMPRNQGFNNHATRLRGWGYAVYRAKDTGQAMDYLLEYANGL